MPTEAKCPECSTKLTKSPSGFICPSGCGRIKSKKQVMELELSQMAQASILGLRGPQRFGLSTANGVWKKSKKVAHAVRGCFSNRKFWFVRDTELEREVARAMGIEVPEFSS